MRVAIFVSHRSANLCACLELQDKFSSLLAISLVVSDHLASPAIDVAVNKGIPLIKGDFRGACGLWKDCKNDSRRAEEYRRAAIHFHDEILEEILTFERRTNPVDIVVLSYHHWIHGKLLHYFQDRMVSQHSGDLSKLAANGARSYVGVNPVLAALRANEEKTRSSTFLVTNAHDGGEILCQGPWVDFVGTVADESSAKTHETRQKYQSDRPCIQFALHEIALGNFGIAQHLFHHDGSRMLTYCGRPLPYSGIDLSQRLNMLSSAD
jgi:phosphoribosylglycinamide formyltransferase 1